MRMRTFLGFGAVAVAAGVARAIHRRRARAAQIATYTDEAGGPGLDVSGFSGDPDDEADAVEEAIDHELGLDADFEPDSYRD